MSWRFYPLAEYPRVGVIVQSDGEKRRPFPAEFLTLEQAKALKPKQITKDAA